ncbi:uncharacterized protein LOC62_02G002607 [Vanrija pseudolonga]|uniref:Uncharacterized protein n=1 Tax=Vanrija pseudolonga TaxID=143232 RepID=A0AAF0Y2M1_9TREE|nr:hypothetical protein LOC62_02G002607 [Vanrija pseudolonga]
MQPEWIPASRRPHDPPPPPPGFPRTSWPADGFSHPPFSDSADALPYRLRWATRTASLHLAKCLEAAKESSSAPVISADCFNLAVLDKAMEIIQLAEKMARDSGVSIVPWETLFKTIRPAMTCTIEPGIDTKTRVRDPPPYDLSILGVYDPDAHVEPRANYFVTYRVNPKDPDGDMIIDRGKNPRPQFTPQDIADKLFNAPSSPPPGTPDLSESASASSSPAQPVSERVSSPPAVPTVGLDSKN